MNIQKLLYLIVFFLSSLGNTQLLMEKNDVIRSSRNRLSHVERLWI